MADFIAFNAGKSYLATGGLPSTCYFGLSTKSIDGTSPYAASDVLSGGSGEITGTSYARQSQAEPTPSSGVCTFTQMTWNTGANTNWSATTRSVFLATTTDNTGTMLCAWNLITGGTARDLSQANTTEQFTPTLTFA